MSDEYLEMDYRFLLRKFPVLDPTKERCVCGRLSRGWRAFESGDFIGIEAEHCGCGTPGKIVATPATDELNIAWVTRINNMTARMKEDAE